MKSLMSFMATLCLGLAALPHADTSPLASRATSPTRTRPFTVSAFESPYPIGQGITGYNLTAHGGSLYLSPDAKVQKAILFVASDGTAYLPVYIDTYDGHLGYASPAPAGAVFVDFVHLGHGDEVFTQEPGFTTEAPSIFQWIGSLENDGWFACAQPNGQYLVFKEMTAFGPPDLSACTEFDASALDYSGSSPAVDSYA